MSKKVTRALVLGVLLVAAPLALNGCNSSIHHYTRMNNTYIFDGELKCMKVEDTQSDTSGTSRLIFDAFVWRENGELRPEGYYNVIIRSNGSEKELKKVYSGKSQHCEVQIPPGTYKVSVKGVTAHTTIYCNDVVVKAGTIMYFRAVIPYTVVE